jgi:hypothetical protein
MISDVLRRPTATVAGIGAVALGLIVLILVLIFRGGGTPLPIVTVSTTDEGIVLRWDNPEEEKAYGPLTYDVEVLDESGKLEKSYLRETGDRLWPGCCRLQIPPGGSITKTLPEQTRPVGSIRLVNQLIGTEQDGKFIKTIICRLTPKPTCSTDD